MCLECITPVEVRAHAGDDAHVPFLSGGHTLTEEVAVIEEFSMAVELNLGGIEREDSGDADKYNVRFGRMPVIGPSFDVHHGRVVLGHVALSDSSDLLLPRLGGCINGSQTWR